jgi:hypothetical protein
MCAVDRVVFGLRLPEAVAKHRPRFGATARQTNTGPSGLAFGKVDR